MQCNHELDSTELIMQKQGFVTSQSHRKKKEKKKADNRYKFIFPPSLSFFSFARTPNYFARGCAIYSTDL